MFVIALQTQVHIYSVDTSAFYAQNEKEVAEKMNKLYLKRNEIKKIPKENRDEYQIYRYKMLNKHIRNGKEILKRRFKENSHILRELDTKHLKDSNVVSVFESSLTRIAGFEVGELTTDIIIMRAFYFDILQSCVVNGFALNGEKYRLFTASAGQIRTKKSVFIKESLWNKHANSLTCGLSIDQINSHGGINVNKYLAYLALTNSATDKWEGFDIDKCIVVDDFETTFKTKVDYIDEKTYKITPQTMMDVTIPHMDGCGICLPKVNRKAFMIRMPWVKGLIVPFQYNSFVKQNLEEYPNATIVKDIYGKEWDILKDGIEIIFTKSQFKMAKYYDSWEDYKNKFKEFNCEAGICNEEPDKIKNAKINYQMVQTLTDITDEELIQLARKLNDDIYNISRDRNTMLKVLGVTEFNENKNSLQKCLEIYPELLQDEHCRQILRDTRKKLVKEGKSARFPVNGKYTFLIPDLYAFSEWLFLDIKNPQGLLKDGEVACKLFKEDNDLDVLRSPHLYLEHAVRRNIKTADTRKWFISKGIYTSVHDPISRILQFDNDGDKALVVEDELLVSIALRNINKYNIVPLYYDMAKADPQMLSNDIFYKGMINAYSGGNIGAISNDITKIWNSSGHSEKDMQEKLMVIKYLCMENNFVIDYAKTLYKPERPKDIDKLIKSYTKAKTPKFFMYAKDKARYQVEEINDSVVNRLECIVKDTKFNFNKIALEKINPTLMMSKKPKKDFLTDIEIERTYYDLLMRNTRLIAEDGYEESKTEYVYNRIRTQLANTCNDVDTLVDNLIHLLFIQKKKSKKAVLFECFGEEIYNNLNNNIKKSLSTYIMCDRCGKRVENDKFNKRRYCDKCAYDVKLELKRVK